MENKDKDSHQIKIENLERSIKMISDIIEGSMPNYTSHPSSVLKEALEKHQSDLRNLSLREEGGRGEII